MLFSVFCPPYVTGEIFTASIVGGVFSALGYFGYEQVKCKYKECCNEEFITADIDKLDKLLTKELYGQKIAHETIVNGLRGHLHATSPIKALAMSFHGTTGVGKTYVSRSIANALYKKGIESKYFHFFNGRNDFPLQQDVEKYKEKLRKIILNSLSECERSMFVFDEVDKMPEGVLNALVPFLDYNPSQRMETAFGHEYVSQRKAIYIFLSNTGGAQIARHLRNLWKQGKQRDQTKIQDFEQLIPIEAFNEKGGLRRSDTIESSVIDYYVPFLPLEEKQVKQCIKRTFLEKSVTPTDEMIKEAMSHVTFGPPPENLYSTAGCKRIEQKVYSIIFSNSQSRLG